MLVNESSIKIDNTSIDYIKFGTGKKVLILIPGVALKRIKGAGLYAYRKYKVFTNEYTVYLIDKRNKISDDFTTKNIAEDYAYAIKQLGIEKADILSISYGGIIAQFLAIEHPELVNKLVLGVTLSKTNDIFEKCIARWTYLATNNKQGELIVDMIEKTKSDEYIKRFKHLFPLISKYSSRVKLSRFISFMKISNSAFPNDRIRLIKSPVLVLGGMQDKVVTPEASLEIAKRLKCDIYMFEDYGHGAYHDTKEFNIRALEFYQK